RQTCVIRCYLARIEYVALPGNSISLTPPSPLLRDSKVSGEIGCPSENSFLLSDGHQKARQTSAVASLTAVGLPARLCGLRVPVYGTVVGRYVGHDSKHSSWKTLRNSVWLCQSRWPRGKIWPAR